MLLLKASRMDHDLVNTTSRRVSLKLEGILREMPLRNDLLGKWM
jgi:hypothetical protein